MMSVKILIADDHPVFLESLGLLIGKIPGFELVGKMHNGKEVVSYLEQSPAGIVLTDIQMPVMDGLELVAVLREQYPDTRVLMLTMLEDAETIKEALKAGAWGYIFKSASLATFEKALNTVASGGHYYSEEVVQRLVEREEKMKTIDTGGLTERELDVVRLIAKELTTAEIAVRLFISVNTVETHRKNIFQKSGVKNSVGLIEYARRRGLI